MLERWNLRAERLERRWSAMSPRRRAWLAALMLTAAVIALFAGIFAVLPLTGNGLIFRDDDYQQHYPFLMAIGRCLRSRTAMFDFSLGFGADRLASLNYYGLGDPLTLLAILFDEKSTHLCYTMLVLLHALGIGNELSNETHGIAPLWKCGEKFAMLTLYQLLPDCARDAAEQGCD